MIAAAALRLLLKRRASSRGRNMTLAYTILMLIITTVAFGTIAKTNTILLVDSVYDPHAADALFCSPTNIATSVFTTLQIYGSDALLVRLNFLRPPNGGLTFPHSCTEHM